MHASPQGRQTACLPAMQQQQQPSPVGLKSRMKASCSALPNCITTRSAPSSARTSCRAGEAGRARGAGRQAIRQAGSEAGRAVGQGKTHASSCHEPLHVLSNPVVHVALGNYQHRS